MHENFVTRIVEGVIVASVYLPPNDPIDKFERSVDEICEAICGHGRHGIVAGNFNAKSPLWGCVSSDVRGCYLSAALVAAGLTPTLDDGEPTFHRFGGRINSILDFMAITDGLTSFMRNARVLPDYTSSDHRYVVHEFAEEPTGIGQNWLRWNARKLNKDKLEAALRAGDACIAALEECGAEERVKKWMIYLLEACGKAMPMEPAIVNSDGNR